MCLFSAKKILPESKEIYDMECAPTISLSFLIFKFLKVFVYLLRSEKTKIREDQVTGNRVRGIPSYGETVYRNIDLMEDQVRRGLSYMKTNLWEDWFTRKLSYGKTKSGIISKEIEKKLNVTQYCRHLIQLAFF